MFVLGRAVTGVAWARCCRWAWFTGYATVFGYSTGSTAILTSLHFTAPVAGMISAVGGAGSRATTS